MRHDAHLDLAVVGCHQGLEAGPDHEARPDASTLIGSNRNVLQIRISARQAARRCDCLVERRVNPMVGIGERHEALHRLAKLRAVAPEQQLLKQGVACLREQGLKRIRIGRVARLDLLRLRQSSLSEEDLLQLLR